MQQYDFKKISSDAFLKCYPFVAILLPFLKNLKEL